MDGKRRGISQQPGQCLVGDRKLTILYGMGIVFAVALTVLASRYPYFPGDIAIAHTVQSLDYGPIGALMWWISAVGTAVAALAITALCAAALAATHRWLEGIFALATLSGEALNIVIKVLVQRSRPSPELIRVTWVNEESGYPSGHVMHFVVFYGFLFYLVWTQMKPSRLRSAALVVLGSLIGLVGLSRIYLGAHWPSDVAGAYLIGVLWLVALICIYNLRLASFSN